MAMHKPVRLKIHDYGSYCTFIAPSESYFAGIKVSGMGRGPFEYEVFEGGSAFLGEGSKSPLRFFHKTSDSVEARDVMRSRILERASDRAIRDGIGLGRIVVKHD